ncbi:hypothetical protein GWI33_023412 [Rhynchophorus ferrugineus]|uniref:Uncharacterized protein n=1 Tax=Rhynchophorus ferrugineus TaxID=354439 RepID=A0A834IRD3_RHYFE|nr:hypothetical protein GWI33_023412 [Rhynchophorus ferrugineus]
MTYHYLFDKRNAVCTDHLYLLIFTVSREKAQAESDKGNEITGQFSEPEHDLARETNERRAPQRNGRPKKKRETNAIWPGAYATSNSQRHEKYRRRKDLSYRL